MIAFVIGTSFRDSWRQSRTRTVVQSAAPLAGAGTSSVDITTSCPTRDFVSQPTSISWWTISVFEAAGLRYRKEEANHNLDTNQRADVMARTLWTGNPTSHRWLDVSVFSALSTHRQDTLEKEIERREKSKHTKYHDLGRAEDAVIVVTSGEQLQNLDQQNQGSSSPRPPLCPRPGPGFHPLLDAEHCLHGCQISRTGSQASDPPA